MNTNAIRERFDDILDPLGIVAGVALVLVGVSTVLGSPWTTNLDTVAVAVQLIGALATVVLGAGLAYLSWPERQ